jgi:hypothetical protein
MLAENAMSKDTYPISATLNPTNPGPVAWPTAAAGRPSLTGGLTAGRIAGPFLFSRACFQNHFFESDVFFWGGGADCLLCGLDVKRYTVGVEERE